ncbi:hypothetical protein [Novosphingobium sp.]|uniref:DUF4139 domain-containing protein n=1 Tax=Novosphingobium sp. TaxID=1874826 RepID=UPI003340F409
MGRTATAIARCLMLAPLLLLAGPELHAAPPAEAVVAASAPIETSVTIYRSAGDGLDTRTLASRLDGYALISETREVDLPAGPAVVRFAGVAAGMLAESVVISGLPGGVREKNLDAQLLSPRHLYAGWFGRPVTLRRTGADGTVHSEPAVVRSAPDGAAIVETAHGFEALTCGPFNDQLVYPGVPDGLFATPTLSIATDAPAPVHVRLRLAYLAWDYDWRADYVLKLAPDLRHGVLNAWVTLASADVTSFPATAAAVVAGHPEFSEARDEADDADAETLTYQCFPRATQALPTPPMVAPPAPVMMEMAMAAPPPMLMKTMNRGAVAQVENLGDLKLYRLPLPTTVAARAQKQVALFAPRNVSLALVHTIALDGLEGDQPAQLMVRTRNRADQGLGLALPAGRVRVLVDHAGSRGPATLVVGAGTVEDRAVNDRVDIALSATPPVQVRQRATHRDKTGRTVTVTVSNANPFAVQFEGTFKQTPAASIRTPSAPLVLQDGHRVWAVRVPAQGRVTLRYRVDDNG